MTLKPGSRLSMCTLPAKTMLSPWILVHLTMTSFRDTEGEQQAWAEVLEIDQKSQGPTAEGCL